MKQLTFFVFLSCFFMSNAVEQPVWKILISNYDLDPSGSYNFNYETENAIQQNEEGSLKRIKNKDGKEEDVVVVRGSYSYQDPNGQNITVVYFADETGFHAEGAHIPVPSAVPGIPAIAHIPEPNIVLGIPIRSDIPKPDVVVPNVQYSIASVPFLNANTQGRQPSRFSSNPSFTVSNTIRRPPQSIRPVVGQLPRSV